MVGTDTVEWRVAGLMTTPRYESVFARNHIDAAFRSAKIPLQVSQGVFYGQCMQRMMESAIEAGVNVAITVDSDSLFTGKDVMRLLNTLAAVDEIDAVSSMQVRRGDATFLGSKKGSKSVEVNGEPFQVSTAHFGLTAIDLSKLSKVPKPWFAASPGAGGTWGDDRVDDDIWFWKRWENSGNSLYIDPGVCIGHLEEMVAVMDKQTFETKHLYPGDWSNSCTSS